MPVILMHENISCNCCVISNLNLCIYIINVTVFFLLWLYAVCITFIWQFQFKFSLYNVFSSTVLYLQRHFIKTKYGVDLNFLKRKNIDFCGIVYLYKKSSQSVSKAVNNVAKRRMTFDIWLDFWHFGMTGDTLTRLLTLWHGFWHGFWHFDMTFDSSPSKCTKIICNERWMKIWMKSEYLSLASNYLL